MRASDNLIRVARALAPIREQRFVFAGASILPLLLNDPAAPPPRSTVDVDAVVDVLTYYEWERLQSRLHDCQLVVRADLSAGKGRICLFHLDQIDVDIMPVRMPSIMPQSRMLEVGFEFAEPVEIEDDLQILALSGPGFLAAKLEAFHDRGEREFPVSKDLDDIVALLDGRVAIAEEVSGAPEEIRKFIAYSANRLLANRNVVDVIADQLRDTNRETRVFELMRKVASG